MGRHLVLIDLSENGGSVIDRLGFPAEQASRQTGDVASEGKLRSGADAYCKSGVVRRRESARTGAEIIGLFGRLNRDGTTLIVVTHDEELASAASRKIHMRDGLIVDG